MEQLEITRPQYMYFRNIWLASETKVRKKADDEIPSHTSNGGNKWLFLSDFPRVITELGPVLGLRAFFRFRVNFSLQSLYRVTVLPYML